MAARNIFTFILNACRGQLTAPFPKIIHCSPAFLKEANEKVKPDNNKFSKLLN